MSSGGSSAYVPDEPEKDTQLQYALKLLRNRPYAASTTPIAVRQSIIDGATQRCPRIEVAYSEV